MSETVISGSNTTWNDTIVADGQIVAVRVNVNGGTSWKYSPAIIRARPPR